MNINGLKKSLVLRNHLWTLPLSYAFGNSRSLLQSSNPSSPPPLPHPHPHPHPHNSSFPSPKPVIHYFFKNKHVYFRHVRVPNHSCHFEMCIYNWGVQWLIFFTNTPMLIINVSITMCCWLLLVTSDGGLGQLGFVITFLMMLVTLQIVSRDLN